MKHNPAKTQEQLKGAALKKLRQAQRPRVTQEKFGQLLKSFGRQEVSNWERGKHWPTELEPNFEKILRAPLAFFARIGIGMAYEEALKAPLSEEGKEGEEQRTIQAITRGMIALVAQYSPEENLREEAERLMKSWGAPTHEKPKPRPDKGTGSGSSTYAD